jgi:SAM-dependent methyltransferase
VIKDHLCDSTLAQMLLKFMDGVGNERYGVALPYNYWSSRRWSAAIADLGLWRAEWEVGGLGLYPWPASLGYGRGLHFVARLSVTAPGGIESPIARSDTEEWEAAYVRFEKPHEEIAKSIRRIRRLRRLGADQWPRSAKILELFCGRGNGLLALGRLGFTHVHGVDLSPRLVGMRREDARCVVGDCRALPVQAESHDVVIVQGGLHHLPLFPDDLEQVVDDVRRVLKPGGLFVVVEPWRTPFLDFVHRVGCSALGRRVWGKMDALATMIEHEGETYQRWLREPELISALLCQRFDPSVYQTRWGKLFFVGRKRP